MRLLIVIVAVVAALLSFIANLPLRWVLPDGIGTASGTVWNGQVSGVPLLGQVRLKGGLGGMNVSTPPGTVTLSADVTPRSVSDLALVMPVAALPTSDGRLSGLAGTFGLRVDDARLADGRCAEASGTARTDVLAANGARFGWTGPELAGPVDCVDGRLRVRLSGENPGAAVEAVTTTSMDGTYESEITVRADDPAAGNALVLFGFSRSSAGEYRLSERGRWR